MHARNCSTKLSQHRLLICMDIYHLDSSQVTTSDIQGRFLSLRLKRTNLGAVFSLLPQGILMIL